MDSQRLRWLPATSNMLHAGLSPCALGVWPWAGRPEPTSPALTGSAPNLAVCAVCDCVFSVGVVDELGCANDPEYLLPGLAAVLAFKDCF